VTDSAHAAQSRLAVLGSPIAHSRSPLIHKAAYDVLGLPWSYEAIECAESEFDGLLASRDEHWLGFSVTMPLKTAAFRSCSVLDPVASESGAVNTLLRIVSTRSTPAWAGFNTDVGGLASALRDAELDMTHTVVLGSGSTAVSALLAARQLGASQVTLLARNIDAVAQIAKRFSEDDRSFICDFGSLHEPISTSLTEATSVISTLPGTASQHIQLDSELLRLPLFDVAYDPWPSALAHRWQQVGIIVHAGIGMLVHQALLQVRIFVNGDPSFPLQHEPQVLAAMKAASVSSATETAE